MAGCFGNSMFDRSMENELMRHLDAEGDYDEYCDRVVNQIPTEIWDSGFGDWFENNKQADKLLSDNSDKLPQEVAGILISEWNKINNHS